MSCKISIVVPVYNAAQHLCFCIESLLSQTLQDIEIILVNDGSTDNSKDIIAGFVNKNDRVIFIDGPNEGVSAARNKAISVATGEFIGFVDSDDWVEPTMYERLYTAAKNSNADTAIGNVKEVNGDTVSKRLELLNETCDLTLNRQQEITKLMRFKYDYANWNKIYSASVINQYQLAFNTRLKIYEDLLFNLCYFQYAQKIIIVNDELYNYRIHDNSVMARVNFNLLAAFNLLFREFSAFCISRNLLAGLEAFETEMRRALYFTIFPKLVRTIRESNAQGWAKRIQLFRGKLQQVEPALYFYNKSELQGIQGMKRMLLKKKWFTFFSMLVFIRN